MEFVSFEIAKKLKEKGFNCELPFAMYNEVGQFCLLTTSAPYHVCESGYRYREYYDYNDFDKNDFIAPTISQVLKWLRKEKKIFMTINIGYCYESYEPFPINPTMEPTITKRCYIFKGYYFGAWELYNLNDKNVRFEYFETPELAAIAGIEYVLDKLI